jgi:hypothetical protein
MTRTQDDRIELLIDQALREFPLESPPEGLKANILGQIEQPLRADRFRISWVDFVFSGALALVIGFVFDFIQDLAYSPYWSTRLRIAFTLFWQDIKYFVLHNQPSIMTASLSAAIVLSLLGILASVYWRYALVSSKPSPYHYQICN